MSGDRSAAAVHEADHLGQLVGDLRRTGERQQLDRKVEALPGDGLGPGELLEPVGAVDASEARVSRRRRTAGPGTDANAMTELTLVMPERILRAISMPRRAEPLNTAPARPYDVALVRSSASSASRTRATVMVGPNVSSCTAALSSGTSTSTVGST